MTTHESLHDSATRLQITVRYFGAARAAATTDDESLAVDDGMSVAELANHLADLHPKLAPVLARCSYLCDGIAVRDDAARLRTGHVIDVLPPFAGG